MRSGLLLLG